MDIELYKERKKELKITFDELAKKSGVSRRAILTIFQDKNANPKQSTIKAIENALGISSFGYENVTTDEKEKGVLPPYRVKNLTVEEDELIEIYREIGDIKGKNAQNLVLKFAEAVLNT